MILWIQKGLKKGVCFCPSRLLQLQWKQDLDMGLDLISKAIEIDNKCDFAYETMGTIEVQRYVSQSVCNSAPLH